MVKNKTLKQEKYIFRFDQRDYDPEAFYTLIVGGEDYDISYNIAFEQVVYSERPCDDSPYNAKVSLVMCNKRIKDLFFLGA